MIVIFDIECYSNYFLIGFKSVDTSKKIYFEMHNDNKENFSKTKIKALMEKHTFVGFNSEKYDILMIKGALLGFNNLQLKKLSDAIINTNKPHWEIERQFNLPRLTVDHIDVCNVSAGFGSLKLYGGRLNSRKLQDLPIEPSSVISTSDAKQLRDYCLNGDLELTQDLYEALLPQINLRTKMTEQYGLDLMSKSDAQIAEAVFKHELSAAGVDVHRVNIPEGTEFKYTIPTFIKFESDEFKQALADVKDAVFVVNDKGSVILPKILSKAYAFNNAKYKMGMGGLHSQEKLQSIEVNPGQTLVDKDVTSYYPNIILNQGLFPKHLTTGFNQVYRSIVSRRIHAKATGDKVTNESLKVTINSSFGKFGSKYSILYSPDLLIQTTVTGQLSLMMLIEQLESIPGVKVYSANTDGIVLLFDDSLANKVEAVCFDWEADTGFDLEDTFYKALYSRDVNNYLAVKPDNSAKGKGMFTLNSISKNPSNVICYQAVIDYLVDGCDIEATIYACDDVTKFTSIRTVNGGAVFENEVIGKSIRWYYAKNQTGCISYAKNNNKVPKTDGARPMMELTDTIPVDLDYDYYIAEAKTILASLGL